MFWALSDFLRRLRLDLSDGFAALLAPARLARRGLRLASLVREAVVVSTPDELEAGSGEPRRWIWRPAESIFQAMPSAIRGADPRPLCAMFRRCLKLRLPEVYVASIPHAGVYGRAYAILQGPAVFRESFWKPTDIRQGVPRKNEPCRYFEGSYALLGLRRWHGYYHWMSEILPRWRLLEETGLLDRAGLLIPKLNQNFQRESLAELLRGRSVKVQEFDETFCRVDRLYFLSPLNPSGFSSSRNIDWMRRRFCPALETSNPKGERIYISRKLAKERRIENEEALVRCLQDHGFTTVHLEEFSFAEQVRLFGRARVVLSSHGAGLTNMMFMPPGGTVVEIFPPVIPLKGIYECYGSMSQACGHLYYCLSSAASGPEGRDLDVNVDEVSTLLGRLG